MDITMGKCIINLRVFRLWRNKQPPSSAEVLYSMESEFLVKVGR